MKVKITKNRGKEKSQLHRLRSRKLGKSQMTTGV